MEGHTAAVGTRVGGARSARLPRVRSARGRLVPACALVLVLAVSGCRTAIGLEDGRYHHPRRGYVIDRPDGAWKPVSAEGADLALRGAQGQMMSLSSRCRTPLASPRVLARHLRIGMGAHRVRAGAAVDVDGHPGWMQIFDARDGQAFVRVKTVTSVVPPCVYDFVLVARHSFPEADRRFDAWWHSFRLPAGPGSP